MFLCLFMILMGCLRFSFLCLYVYLCIFVFYLDAWKLERHCKLKISVYYTIVNVLRTWNMAHGFPLQELLSRHKSVVAEFLAKNYDWFFAEYNSELLESSNYITRSQPIKLLGDFLLDRSNFAVILRLQAFKTQIKI